MSCTDFPSTGLIPNVTTHTVGNITYIWTGIAWESQVNVPAGELVNDLSQAYIFDTVADFKASTLVFPVGKRIYLEDRGAYFIKDSGVLTPNGYNIIASDVVLQNINLEIVDKIVNVKHWGAKANGADDYLVIQDAFDYLEPFVHTIFFPADLYLTSDMLTCDTSGITVLGEGKYISYIQPHADFAKPTQPLALMKLGNGTTTAYQTIKEIGLQSTVSYARDSDALIVHSFYNLDIDNIRVQGGDQVTKETAGLRIKDGRHTRVNASQFHNSFCQGMIVEEHLTGLNITGNAFDESATGIKSLGNILEMNITGANEFGAARNNPSYPADTFGRCLDLEIGNHGRIVINGNLFSGGGGTRFHIRWNFSDNMVIVGNSLAGALRYSLCCTGTPNLLTITGNGFVGNGDGVPEAEGGIPLDINPANGLRNPDTTPFCSDIYLNGAFYTAATITGNSSDLIDRPPLWAEGTSVAFGTSGISVGLNTTKYDYYGYVHSKLVPTKDVLVMGSFTKRGLPPVEDTISGRTITRGTAAASALTYTGVVVGDVITISPKVYTDLDYNLVISARVQSDNIVRWIIVNTSDIAVVMPDLDVIMSCSTI